MATTVKVHNYQPSLRKIDIEFQTSYPPVYVQMGRDQAAAWGLLSNDDPEDAAGGIRLVLTGLHRDMCFGDHDTVVDLLKAYIKDVWIILVNKVKDSIVSGDTVNPAAVDGTTFDAG
jgi:hypothetical protein